MLTITKHDANLKRAVLSNSTRPPSVIFQLQQTAVTLHHPVTPSPQSVLVFPWRSFRHHHTVLKLLKRI